MVCKILHLFLQCTIQVSASLSDITNSLDSVALLFFPDSDTLAFFYHKENSSSSVRSSNMWLNTNCRCQTYAWLVYEVLRFQVEIKIFTHINVTTKKANEMCS